MKLLRYFVGTFLFTLLNSAWANPPTIVVAANMKPPMEEIYQQYKSATGQEFRIIYGASGNLTRQIQQGAPFNLFVSADENFPLALSKEGFTVDEGKVYAIGRLAIIANKGRGIKLSLKEDDLRKIITSANKIALAKPDLAPYGKAAVEFLTKMGLIHLAKDKFAYGENISSATNFVVVGAAPIGFTAYSLAISKEVARDADYLLIPENLHEPIRQRMVLIKNPPQSVVDFYNYLQGPQAKAIIKAHGYAVP
ncbi:molybdate ABC transporter substrate-binding protein [Polynucleobacter victoriensis]|uniref:Molybdate transport system substrate-binding protein n=1 Tax=Polynucleobacter victoriensis TaxID=2049319 RepID=A0A212U1P9_9BURK|nr:molybdate ABC transporter substrate-binding protein [Polynucleobacter victoriensis]SNC72195.1 molybdate transport system substrate-binding protein [Polynucleobacter victoriensis]